MRWTILKKIYRFMKKIVMSIFLLYGYNLIATPLNIVIPINIFTVAIVTVLGIPSLFALITIFLLLY